MERGRKSAGRKVVWNVCQREANGRLGSLVFFSGQAGLGEAPTSHRKAQSSQRFRHPALKANSTIIWLDRPIPSSVSYTRNGTDAEMPLLGPSTHQSDTARLLSQSLATTMNDAVRCSRYA